MSKTFFQGGESFSGGASPTLSNGPGRQMNAEITL